MHATILGPQTPNFLTHMTIQFHDTDQCLSRTLREVRAALRGEQVTLAELLALIGEQGLLLFVMFLMTPFLLPVSIPGVSTVFSLIVILVGLGVATNRLPWLPARLLNHAVAIDRLLPALDKGARLMERVEQFIQPRWLFLTHGPTVNRFNGLMLVLGGVLLLFPLGFVPFSNTFPGIAVLLLAAGLLQRDGLFVVLGYLMLTLTVVYFGALAYAVFIVGASLQDADILRNLF